MKKTNENLNKKVIDTVTATPKISGSENATTETSGHTTQEITLHIPPKSAAVVPHGWVGSGSVITYPVGTLTAGSWLFVNITANSARIPVILQLYTSAGQNYSSKTVTVGSCGWESKVTAYHSLLITNDNNYGTDISFQLTYS